MEQNVWISGISTVAVTMFFTLVAQSFLSNNLLDLSYWFGNNFGIFGDISLPIIMAIVPTFVLWLFKARVIDKNKITPDGVKYAGTVTVAGAVVVIISSLVSDRLFEGIVDLIHPNSV